MTTKVKLSFDSPGEYVEVEDSGHHGNIYLSVTARGSETAIRMEKHEAYRLSRLLLALVGEK